MKRPNTLTEKQAAEYCLYFEREGVKDPVRAFRECAKRYAVPVSYIGRFRHYEIRFLDAFIERRGWLKRHALRRVG